MKAVSRAGGIIFYFISLNEAFLLSALSLYDGELTTIVAARGAYGVVDVP